MLDPKILLGRFILLLQLVGVILSMYMTAVMVNRYLLNEDVTSITYKRYNQSPRDKYPTFSVCFEGTEFHWIHDHQVFGSYGLAPYRFELMLMGENASRNEYNPLSRLYDQIPVSIGDVPDDRFDQFYLKPNDILVETKFETLCGTTLGPPFMCALCWYKVRISFV